MTSGKLLRQVIKAASEGNQKSFQDAVSKVINEERQKQHHLLANDLEQLLYNSGGKASNPARASSFGVVPADKERGSQLLEIHEPVISINDVILDAENRTLINRILIENNQRELLGSFGLKPVQKVLFYGPPGCGKNVTGEAIAYELGLPLVLVRIDSVISSYLGETAANLRKVFEYAKEFPAVFLFDEFDALAKERSIEGDHGELKRVVSAFLQMLDAYRGRSLLIATTNHEKLLDDAIWRRFDEIVSFAYPSINQISNLLATKLRTVRCDFDTSDEKIALILKEKSHADIERIIIRAMKDMVLKGEKFLTIAHLEDALKYDKSKKL